MQDYLPGFEPEPPSKGYVETETEKTIDNLRDNGLIGDESAGLCALAIMAARSLDQMGRKGAPSGRAMLLNAAREIFESIKPQGDPSAGADLAGLLTAIQTEDIDEAETEYTNAANIA